MQKKRSSVHLLFMGLFLSMTLSPIFTSCQVEPKESDIKEVKRHFLSMRYMAPFFSETKNSSDKELFERSCSEKRVACKKVLSYLKKSDLDFYRILNSDSKNSKPAP